MYIHVCVYTKIMLCRRFNVDIGMHVSCMAHLNPLQNGWVEDVHASIDLVGHKYLGLLYKPLDLSTLCVVHYHTILAWLIHFCHLVHSVERGVL